MLRIPNFKTLVGSLSPAYAAALALIAIQVSIGLLYKASQTNGKYGFSASSSVTISESLKFLLSSYLFYREWRKRGYAAIADEQANEIKFEDVEEGKEVDGESSSDTLSLEEEDYVSNRQGTEYSYGHRRFQLKAFLESAKDEIPAETRYGFMHLALFYVLINNTIFVLFRLADPGTIQLIKSGTTLITAIVMIVGLGTKVSGGQWIAIVLQVCGIIVTQYGPNGGATYPVSTYLLLVFQTTLSAVSSVYNQKLCKSVDGSLHVMNMTLYASGACINLVLHVLIRIMNPAEPGFFTGYMNIGAVMVIISNVFIGLAMTAVYKYADALIKCFATAISTGLLLYISPLLFNINFSFLVLPGTCVVFLATWLYMDATPKPAAQATMTPAPVISQRSFISRLTHALSPHGAFRRGGLLLSTCVAFVLVGMLTYGRTHMIPTEPLDLPMPGLDLNNTMSNSTELTNVTMPIVMEPQVPAFDSPFKNTLAFIRLNFDLPKRVETLTEGYAPFFAELHFSMPSEGHNVTETNATRDYWWDPQLVYPPVQETLQIVLDDPEYAHIEGMLFYHFDAWIEPLGFGDMDFNKIWALDNADAPPYLCMKDTSWSPGWQWFGAGKHEEAKSAMRIAKQWLKGYEIDSDEFCVGWSDMYYLPRRFFHDFIQLSSIFASVGVFHEIGMPTMFNIIDKTYRPHSSLSVITRWSDCWGGCCSVGVRPTDIYQKRCGHRIDYLNWEVAVTHFDRLKQNAKLLGTPIPVVEVDHSQHGTMAYKPKKPKKPKQQPKQQPKQPKKSKPHSKEGGSRVPKVGLDSTDPDPGKGSIVEIEVPPPEDAGERIRHLLFF